MQQINLTLPSEAYAQLRELATAEGRNASETAVELLVRAVESAHRQLFYRTVSDAQTPALRARELRILDLLEQLDV